MEDESRDEEDIVAEDGDDQGKERPWYPYITKTQFEKFLSRLQSKVPDEIDRDYVRAIIRTPSMIYRFLRGVEAMGLIDPEQRPTDRLRRLVDKETRKQALSEVVRDLYPILMEKMQEAGGEMPDRDIVAFFRKETGMGNDSANKMKMFFKYLLSEADDTATDVQPADDSDNAGDDAPEAASGGDEATEADSGKEAEEEAEEAEDNVGNEADPPPAAPARGRGRPAERSSQRGGNDRSERGGSDRGGNDRSERGGNDRGGNDRNERGGSDRGGNDRSERGGNDRGARGGEREEREERGGRGGRGGRDRGGRGNDRNDRNDRAERDSERDSERVPSNRPLTEAQRAYLDTLKSVLRVNVDGDWDDDMIRLAFDRLERLFDRIRRG